MNRNTTNMVNAMSRPDLSNHQFRKAMNRIDVMTPVALAKILRGSRRACK